jgi:hypothetical protein
MPLGHFGSDADLRLLQTRDSGQGPVHHALCSMMIAPAEPWLLGGCSYATTQANTR